jgi:hypothetical protein
MTAYCGPHSGKEMLEKLPANGRWDSWTKGRETVATLGQSPLADCTVWYHHDGYSPCSHREYTFDRPCGDALFRESGIEGGGD